MSVCERCWSDAGAIAGVGSRVDAYARIVRLRHGNATCTAEQQAGPWATECTRCERMTVHQATGACTNSECAAFGVRMDYE